MEGTVQPGDTIRMMSNGSEFTVVECGRMRATSFEPSRELASGEVGLSHGLHQGGEGCPRGRHHHPGGRPRRRAAAGLPRRAAHGVLRHLSCGRREVPGSARRAREAPAQRRRPLLRAGDVRGAGLRFPLRVPGASAHGDHPGAARARIQSRSRHDGAERCVPHHEDGRQRCVHRQSDELSRPVAHRAGGGADGERAHLFPHGLCGQHHGSLSGPPRHVPRHDLY